MNMSYTLVDTNLVDAIANIAGYDSEGINVIVDFSVEKEVDFFDHAFGKEPTLNYYVDPSDLEVYIEPLGGRNSSLEIKPAVPFDLKLLSGTELTKLLDECQACVDNYDFS